MSLVFWIIVHIVIHRMVIESRIGSSVLFCFLNSRRTLMDTVQEKSVLVRRNIWVSMVRVVDLQILFIELFIV